MNPNGDPSAHSPPELLEKAKHGHEPSREKLLGWAYVTASDYYLAKTACETALTRADAQDLAGAFYVEFERAWPRIHTLHHYTRRMLRNNLNRHLRRAREHRRREVCVADVEAAGSTTATVHWDRYRLPEWGDDDWLRYRIVRSTMRNADARTRELIRYRSGAAELTYREIAERMNTSEAALRMRMARFYATVRTTYEYLASPDKNDD